MDWSLCPVCQQQISEALKCPLNAPGEGDKSVPYQAFLDRVAGFKELEILPLPLTHLPENVTVQDFVQNKAKWHKSCHIKFSQDKLERARKRNATETELESSNGCGTKRICQPHRSLDRENVFFVKKACGKLHQFSTFEADTNVRTIAKDLNDTSLFTKIQGGDLIALESKYHLSCLAKLRNHHRSYLRENEEISSTMNEERKMEARAFAKLLSHIETSVQEGTFLFKFSELRALYEKRLGYFGIPKEINKV